MFKSKLGSLRQIICEGYGGMIGGYCQEHYGWDHYPVGDEHYKFTEALKSDKYLYWLSESFMSCDLHHQTVIDASDDLMQLYKTFGDDWEGYEAFNQLCKDEFTNQGEYELPFPNMLIYCGNVATEVIGTKIHADVSEAVIRVADVTEQWNTDQATKFKKVIELTLFSKVKNTIDNRFFHVPVCAPMQLFLEFDGTRDYGLEEFPKTGVNESLYPGMKSDEEIRKYVTCYSAVTLHLVALFAFMYKHQKITYNEVQAPEGLNKKRRKKNVAPYEHYFVSRLGDYTKSVYTESNKTGRGVHGVAMHIRRGHWRLQWGHRQLPPEKQKKVWIESTVAGDPRYGIIIRDYETDLINQETLDEIETAKS